MAQQTRTVTRSKVHLGSSLPLPKSGPPGKGARDRMHRMYGSENVLRCTRCPQDSFCASCHGVNTARIKVGLIRPKHQEDHRNNILYPMPINKSARVSPAPANHPRQPVVTAHLRQLGGGWRQGLASLDGEVIYEGPKTQSMDKAWAYAKQSADMVKKGLNFEMRMLRK